MNEKFDPIHNGQSRMRKSFNEEISTTKIQIFIKPIIGASLHRLLNR